MQTPMDDPSFVVQADSLLPDMEADLWRRWRDGADIAARNALIQQFLPYARLVAAVYYKGRTHDDIEFSDYMQLASIGVMEAVDRFDPTQGAQFKTYASHRMRGAILNGLERMSEKSQQIAFHKRIQKERLADVKAQAKANTGLAPQDTASSSVNGQKTLLNYLAEVGVGLAIGVLLEGTGMVELQDAAESGSAASPEIGYFKKTEMQQLQSLLRELVDHLSVQERTVIRGYYQQDIAFEQISGMLGVTRSRVSQLHRQALTKLRNAMRHGPPLDIEW